MALQPKHSKEQLPDGRADRYLRQEEEDTSTVTTMSQAAKAALSEWLASLTDWDLYATLTYDPGRTRSDAMDIPQHEYRPSVAHCLSDVQRYWRGLHACLSRPVRAVVAVETHQNGWPHAHVLLGMDGINSAGFVRCGRLWFQNHGYAHLTRVDSQDTPAVAAYLCKYFQKADAEVAILGNYERVTTNGS